MELHSQRKEVSSIHLLLYLERKTPDLELRLDFLLSHFATYLLFFLLKTIYLMRSSYSIIIPLTWHSTSKRAHFRLQSLQMDSICISPTYHVRTFLLCRIFLLIYIALAINNFQNFYTISITDGITFY